MAPNVVCGTNSLLSNVNKDNYIFKCYNVYKVYKVAYSIICIIYRNMQNCKICKKGIFKNGAPRWHQEKYAHINVSRYNHNMCLNSIFFKWRPTLLAELNLF